MSLIPLVVRLAGEVFEDVFFLQRDLWVTAALMIPALRLFSGIEKIRVLWFSLLVILPRYQNIFVLLFLGMYQFACIGCWMLAGRFRYLAGNTWSWEPQANFNSMLDAIATLFQLFIGESWYKVKDAAHETNGGFIMLYFPPAMSCACPVQRGQPLLMYSMLGQLNSMASAASWSRRRRDATAILTSCRRDVQGSSSSMSALASIVCVMATLSSAGCRSREPAILFFPHQPGLEILE